MIYVEPFEVISKKDSARYGGKVASLGDMFQANIPVPPGFGISIEAHRVFENKAFSKDFKDQLQNAFDALNTKRVAVRSSAVAEDAKDASWAGQLESYLNVPYGKLETGIRACWQSVKAEHVKNYAQDKNLSKDSLLVGVAVQAMVESEAAGVMFTTNPITQKRTELMIEAAYGLGETVVQGITTPDNFKVNSTTMSVEEFNIQIKEKMMVFKSGKNQIVDVPERIADRAVLREAEVVQLAKLGMSVARHYGSPQDIEWARYDGKFYIVQARPITTLSG